MNFKEIYDASVTIKKQTSIVPNPYILIPNLYSYENLSPSETAHSGFLHLLAAGNLFCEDLFYFSFQPMDCCMLLYTTEGSGALTANGRTASLTARHLIFFDCNQRFSLQSTLLPWSFKIFFLSGERLAFFRSLFRAQAMSSFELPEFSPLCQEIGSLLSIDTEVNLPQFLKMQQLLNNILTSLYLSAQPYTTDTRKDLPPYLIEMKDTFDHHYTDAFSLETLQERYGVSKYRLCREFSAHFGTPPLRYLNDKRLTKAKEMLLTSDLNIQTISSLVGFDNVNHFINLFKKYIGATPSAFRQTARAGQPVLHSPVQ